MLDQAIDILLIEDNPDDVELTLHAFRKCAPVLHIHVIRDGAEAMDFLHCTGAYAKRNPHLNPRMILLDLKMPPVDGHYVLRQIRANPYTRTVPVVVLTSSREERDVFRTYQLGINSYIVKPVDFDAFID
ncbi:MAG: two-component system response regulator, partial [Nitrospiraceae bacterium]